MKALLLICVILLSAFAQPPAAPTSSGLSCTNSGICTGNCYSSAKSYYKETINGNSISIETNGIPQTQYMHSIVKANPNKPCEQKLSWTFTQKTDKGSTFTDTGMGIIGVTRAGAFIFNHLATADGSGINDVANHVDGEALSLDACYGHADANCQYHQHAMKNDATCNPSGKAVNCQLIGWLVDGRRFFSTCKNAAGTRDLKSCYVLTGTGGESSSDYTFTSSSECDLDEANGYDFTGKGINDSDGNAITGYAYVATDAYPWVQTKFADTAVQCFTTGTFDTSSGCVPGSCTLSVASSSSTAGYAQSISLFALFSVLLVLLQ